MAESSGSIPPLTTHIILIIVSLFTFFIFIVKVILPKSWNNQDYPPFMGTMIDEIRNFHRLYDFYTDISIKCRTFRIFYPPSTCYVYTCDPANIEHVLKTNFANYPKGEDAHDKMEDVFGDGIFNVDGDAWKHQRKLASYEFSTRAVRDYSSAIFKKKASDLAESLSDAASNKSVIDLQDLLMNVTLESIFIIRFGVELKSVNESSEKGGKFAEAFREANVLIYWRYVDVLWKMKWFLNIGGERNLKSHIKVIDDIVYQLIHHKKEQFKTDMEFSSKRADILSRFLLARDEDPDNITDKYLRDIILSFMLAGRDSNSVTLSWFIYMMCKHQSVEQKIDDEVNAAMKMNSFTSIREFAESITESALDEMQYLHATLTETLRLYPAVPVDGKECIKDDVLPDGFKVKKGYGVLFPIFSMGRMTYLWGDDASEFRPERWLQNGVFQQESPFKFPIFLAGPRICLGKEFAYRQMKIIAATLVHFFRFKLKDESKEVRYKTMFTLHIEGGLPVHVYRK